MPRIVLYDLVDLMLVVEYASGVIYTNQAGGNVCLQPQIEGVLVPLDFHPDRAAKLCELGSEAHLTPELADQIDAILADQTNRIRVDRTRLRESTEAWLFVEVDTPADHEDYGNLFDFGQVRGVLTWANSD